MANLRKQRQLRCAQAEEDVALLLSKGLEDIALDRVELVIKERNMLEVLAAVESHCDLIVERAFVIDDEQKKCPEELREAAAELVYASYRCGDLPELREVRSLFSSMFGKEFTHAATVLRNNSGVTLRMFQRFSTKKPSLEIRAKTVNEIAIDKAIVDPPSETEKIRICDLLANTERSSSCDCMAKLRGDINSLRSELRDFIQRFEMNYPLSRSS